jgi:hypothetical protein
MQNNCARRLLLHTCCAPCLTQCLNVLNGNDLWQGALEFFDSFDISVFFYNPNIYPRDEYERRLDEVTRLARTMGDFPVIVSKYDTDKWFELTSGMDNDPEKGRRCRICYEMRLREAFKTATENSFDIVASTLTLSPHKDATAVNNIGRALSSKHHIAYLASNFKKNDGFKKSIALSKQYSLYRQDYCGCLFSMRSSQKLPVNP